MSDHSIEQQLHSFEDAWRAGQTPELSAYAQQAEPRLIIELVHTDLEYRLKRGDGVRVERYFDEFPWIAADELLAQELIAAEFRLRSRSEPELNKAEYQRRFPQWESSLSAFLQPTLSQPVAHPPERTAADNDTNRPNSSLVDVETLDSHAAAAPSPPSTKLPQIPGYEMLRVIAAGGMGVVYEAVDQTLRRRVAIKLPRTQMLAGTDDQQRFFREARSAARLSHPHICPIYEVGEYGDQPYLALAYIDGVTLRQWAQEQQPSPHAAAEMVATLAETIHFAHEHGVVHRDIKPANVMIEAGSGRPVLMDFGLAKELADADSHVTRSGQVMGTPAYMAPEQAAGRNAEIGPCSDIYGLGAVMFELISGQVPFLGTVGEVLQQVQTEDAPSLRRVASGQVHRDLDTICAKALSRRPVDRYPTAAELAADLRRFCSGEAILARRLHPAERLWRRMKRSPWATVAVTLTLAVALAAIVFGPRIRDTLHVADLTRQVQQQLDQSPWQLDQVEKIRPLISQLEAYDPQAAELTTARLIRRMEDHVAALLQQSRLEPADEEQLERTLAMLSRWDDAKAAQLRAAWERRKRTWQEVFDLHAPFDAEVLKKWFPQQDLQFDATAVWNANRHSSEVLSSVLSGDNMRLEAEFEGDWQDASQLGLLLNARGGHRQDVTQVAWGTKDGQGVSLDRAGVLKFWDLATGRQQDSPLHANAAEDVRRFAQSPDHRWLAMVRLSSPVLEIWNWQTRQHLHTLKLAERGGVWVQLDFSPTGDQLACTTQLEGSGAAVLRVFEVATGKPLHSLTAHDGMPTSLKYSPDGAQLAAGDSGGNLIVWNTADWETRLRANRHSGLLTGICWIPPQSGRVATTSSDGLVKIWDGESWGPAPTRCRVCRGQLLSGSNP